MKMAFSLIALLLVACSRPPEPVSVPAITAAAAPVPADPLTGQIWLRGDPSAAPGDLLAFLSGGSLLMTSCGEPYRLARWQREGGQLRWDEDGEPIHVRILVVDAEQLKLEFQRRDGPETKTYRADRAARVCPDLPR